MEYVFKYNQSSTDPRVKNLAQIFRDQGYQVMDWHEPTDQKAIYFLEPRCEITQDLFQSAVVGSLAFGYQKQLSGINYVSLNDDENFIRQNNHLTALALQQILAKTYHGKVKKMLICGWGKLANALEQVFSDWEISVLNFNFHKIPELTDLYGDRAYFEKSPFAAFPVIVNTIPKPLIKPVAWEKRRAGQLLFDLASAPYGFDWVGVNQNDYQYQILPGLPGKYFPAEAAQAVYDSIDRYLQAQAKPTIVLGITGSACSYLKLLPILKIMVKHYEIIPVLSPNADQPNRFTNINDFKQQIRDLTGHNIITNIAGAETLSSNQRVLASVIFPATGNTIAKLTHGITDTCVLMAAKALLRNNKPCIVGLSTNDALSGNAQNIGALLNRRNFYFVPFGQDDIVKKPYSCVCDFTKVIATIDAALKGQQLQPLLLK